MKGEIEAWSQRGSSWVIDEILEAFINVTQYRPLRGGSPLGGRGVLGSIFAGYEPPASQNPYPIIVYSWLANPKEDPSCANFNGR